jgi:tetratricopeptide (TPR) repeat protein
MERLNKKAHNGGESNIRYIKKAIEKYPHTPHLKNYLSVAYMNSGMEEESYKINDRIIKEHPQYLFGILNKAHEYLNKGEHKKMPELMGENMDLRDLFPEREVFHVTEMTSFLETAIHYFMAENNFEAIKSQVEILKELDPEHPLVLSFEDTLSILGTGDDNMPFGSDKLYPKPAFKTYDKSVQTEEAPTFQNEIIYKLYDASFDIDQGIFNEILKSPRESVIPDLKKVLRDSVCRYEYFRSQEEEGDVDESALCFPIHATFLLGEMKAGEAMDDILEILRQGDEFLDFWYKDILFEAYWIPLYQILPENQETYKQFMFEPGIYTYAKSAISQTCLQYFLHHPEKREEISAWYKEVLNAYLTIDTANVVDAELIAFMVCEVMDADFRELLPIINQLYDAGYVEEYIAGTKEEVQRDFGVKSPVTSKNPLLSIYEQYDEILDAWYFGDDEDPVGWQDVDEELEKGVFDDIISIDENKHQESYSNDSPFRKPPKIGRNEPCPCGSGKKYKKCCGKNV